MKVSIIGAGNVGGLTAMRILESGMADVCLVDILSSLAQAKALDLQDASPIISHSRHIQAGDDFSLVKDSRIIVITAGLPRQPGMSREDLLKKNLAILKDVYLKVKPYLKETIVIIVTNPLDVMTYAFKQLSGIERNHLIGMGPSLDSSRLANLLSQELSVPVNEIKTMVVADHGKDMLPLLRLSTFQDKPIVKRLDQETCHGVKERTIDRGRQIVELFKTGSAYFAPSAAIFQLVRAILEDRKEVIPVCAFLEGEYGLKDIAIGVPAIIAKEGIKEIIELTFTTEEHRAFLSAAEALRKLQSGIV